jgi:hypothetical protein
MMLPGKQLQWKVDLYSGKGILGYPQGLRIPQG